MRANPFRAGLVLLPAILLAACGGSGETVVPSVPAAPSAPTLRILTPASAVVVPLAIGGEVEITYVDDAPDGVAWTDIVADRDGDLSTTADQIVVASQRPDGDGIEQSVTWLVEDAPHGLYRIVGRTFDGQHHVIHTAPGTVELNAPPALQMDRPEEDGVTSRGGIFRIACISEDPDDVPHDSLAADEDGDPATLYDQHTFVDRRRGGVPQDSLTRLWNVPVGDYAVLGTTDDDVNPPVTDTAAGRVTVRNVGWADQAHGTAGNIAFGAGLHADGVSVVTGTFWDQVTFGKGDPLEATLFSAGSQDAFLACYAADGRLAWARSVEGAGLEYASDVAVSDEGDCAIVGYFGGDILFGAGEANEAGITPVGHWDAYLARYDRAGTFRWVAQIGGPEFVDARAVASVPGGACIVAGTFGGTATFGAGQPNETVLTASGAYDVFVARYDDLGRLAWARRVGGIGLDQAWGVAGFEDGSCAVCGNVGATSTFGPGEPGETILSPRGGLDMFVARYSSAGRLLWARLGGGPSWDTASGVAAAPGGGVVLTGSFDDTAVFDGGTAPSVSVVGRGGRDGFVARYSADGDLAWVHGFGGTALEAGEDVAAFPDDTFVIVGSFQGEMRLGLGGGKQTALEAVGTRDLFTACFLADGELAWAWSAGGSGVDTARAVASAPDGSGLVVGSFQDTMTVGSGWPHETVLTADTAEHTFAIRFNGDGGL